MEDSVLDEMEADAKALAEQAKRDAAFARKVLDVVKDYRERRKADPQPKGDKE